MSLLYSDPSVLSLLTQSDSKVVSRIYRLYRICPLSLSISLFDLIFYSFPHLFTASAILDITLCFSNILSLLLLRDFLCLGISPSSRYPHGFFFTSFWSLLHSYLIHRESLHILPKISPYLLFPYSFPALYFFIIQHFPHLSFFFFAFPT